jgi:hypothetical protein
MLQQNNLPTCIDNKYQMQLNVYWFEHDSLLLINTHAQTEKKNSYIHYLHML